jgi:DNA-binding CsgD family transcriptional regulator
MLTGRELDVAALLMKGCSERTVAETLGIGYTTVRSHSRSLRRKFGVTSRSQLLLRLIDSGLSGRNPPPD